MGEIQARQQYRDAGYPSMYAYCVGELHMSEDVAWKRTRVAALARRFPVILDMVAEGRLHLTAVVHLLPRRNTPDFVQLLEAAAHKTKAEIELLLEERFPRPDVPSVVRPLAMSGPCQKLVPEPDVPTHIRMAAPDSGCAEEGASMGPEADSLNGGGSPMAPDASLTHEPASPAQPHSTPEPLAPEHVATPEPRARVQPPAPQRFAIQVTVAQATHDKLRRAQELLGHRPLHGSSRPSACSAPASWSESAGTAVGA